MHPLSSNGRDPIIVREPPERVAWINREARRLAAREEHRMARTLPPFKVARDGTVTERAGGAIIGHVWLDSNLGWIGSTVNGGQTSGNHPNGRKYAAQAVWEASPYYVRPYALYKHPEEPSRD